MVSCTMINAATAAYDIWYDATTVGADLVVQCWISHGPRTDEPSFDPQPGDYVRVGDDEEAPLRAQVIRRHGDPGRCACRAVRRGRRGGIAADRHAAPAGVVTSWSRTRRHAVASGGICQTSDSANALVRGTELHWLARASTGPSGVRVLPPEPTTV